MPNDKEHLGEVGLDDLGRFAIGKDSGALYFDGLRVQVAPEPPLDDRLKREIESIIHTLVDSRLRSIESSLKVIRSRLSSIRDIVEVTEKATGVNIARTIEGQIHNRFARSGVVASKKAKSKHGRRYFAKKK